MPITDLEPVRVSQLGVLDEDARLDPDLDPHLSPEEALRLYEAMVFTRALDARMLNLQRQGRIGTFPPTTGQEAISCGSALAMGPRDWLVPTYREVGARVLRGEDPLQTLLYYKGFEEGSTTPRDLRIVPTQVVLGTQAPHAVGVAWAMKVKREDAAVLTFFGDGASSEGDVHEAMNFAGAWKVPVVFVCVNNQWAISTPLSKQTAAPSFAHRAAGYGFPGVVVDGNDALAVYKAVKDALDRARQGLGPSLIEARTWRLLMHTTADDPTKYRDERVTQEMWKREPLLRYRRYLTDRGLWSDARQEEQDARVKARVDEVVARLEALPPAPPEAPFDHVFHTPQPLIERQKRAFLAENGGSNA